MKKINSKLYELKISSKKQELERAKHSDLIVLPDNIEGTNCGNCKFLSKQDRKNKEPKKGKFYCAHEDIQQYVTARHCCAYWDHEDVKREWMNH